MAQFWTSTSCPAKSAFFRCRAMGRIVCSTALLLASRTEIADRDAEIARRDEEISEREARLSRKADRILRLEKLVADFKRALFGARSEKATPEQYELALEDIEVAMAAVHAEDEAIDPPKPAQPRKTNRGSLPKHLPRIEEIIEPEEMTCACGDERHLIGEDVSELLDTGTG